MSSEKIENRNFSRKKFLQMTCLTALGASLIPERRLTDFYSSSPAPIALQLYTVRSEFEKDIAGTLHKVAQVGFEAVETAFWPENITIKQASKLLNEAGLAVCSAHIELPVGEKKSSMLETAEAFHCKRMIWHGWPEDKRYSTADGTKELADLYNEANHFAKVNGLQFGLHNHWWEFRNKVDGRYVYEVLLERLEPDIFFEIDTYWVKVAGHDPAKIVGHFGKRAQLLHIKDGPAKWNDSLPADNPDPMVAVGAGTQDFPAIVKAAGGNTAWMVVEMDRVATDLFTAIQNSYNYLVKNGLAKGKKSV